MTYSQSQNKAGLNYVKFTMDWTRKAACDNISVIKPKQSKWFNGEAEKQQTTPPEAKKAKSIEFK